MSDTTTDCDVLILGASFAGVELYYQLRRSRAGRALAITIVDRQAEHGYIPLCQERLVLRLPLTKSALPTARCVAADPRARYLVDEVQSFDPATREATLASGARVRGRFVVVALGTLLAPPPGLPGGEHLLGYKLEREFAATQQRLLARLAREDAARLVVIGGGVSGVELAGELAHWAAHGGAPGRARPQVTLVDAGDRLLRGLTERAGRAAARKLQAQGVTLRLRTRVLAVTADRMRLHTADGEPDELAHDGGFWAGGVRPAPVLAQLGLPMTPGGYLEVGPTLQCFPGVASTHPQIFACGDAARVVDDTGEWPTMQRAIECIWEAGVVARNILALAAAGDRAPVLRRLKLRRDFFHGVSIGTASMVVYGWLAVELGFFGVWFRRFLMQMYFRRYGAPGGSGPARRPATMNANADADAAAAPGA